MRALGLGYDAHVAAPHECPVRSTQGGPELSTEDRTAVRLALHHLVDPTLAPTELVVIKQLDEGRSPAHVYEGELVLAGGKKIRVVVKVDKTAWLENELESAAACARGAASNVAPVLAPTLEGARKLRPGRAAIVYRHAAEPWAGQLESLRALTQRALDQPHERQRVIEVVKRTVAALDRQMHDLVTAQTTGSHQLQYYLQRWLPSATLRVDDVDQAGGRIFLRVPFGAPDDARELEIGRKDFVHGTPSRAAHEQTNARVSIRLGLRDVGGNWVGSIPCEGTLGLGISPAVRDALSTWSSTERRDVEVRGELVATRYGDYAKLLNSAGLDPDGDTWTVGDHEFPNSLRDYQDNLWRWDEARGEGQCDVVFGHGDLHDCNVLCVGHEFTIIDLGLAGQEHPRWADAARLIASLLLNALAPRLTPAQLARALHLAFRTTESLDLQASDLAMATAALLRGAFEAALAATKQQAVHARRELWIDIHHFCWIGLKWCRSEDETTRMNRVMAMALLAAVAARCVDAEVQALVRRRDDDALEQNKVISEIVVRRFERDGDAHGVLTLKTGIRSLLAGIDASVLFTEQGRSKILDAHVERALVHPEWGDADVGELQDLHMLSEHPLEISEEVLLVDVILIGCSRKWNDRAFLQLLTMCDSGEESVALEAVLAVLLLMRRPAAPEALSVRPKVRKQLARTLARPEVRRVMIEVGRTLDGLVHYDMTLLARIEALHAGARPAVFWALRPFRGDEQCEVPGDPGYRSLLRGLEGSFSFSDLERHAFARAYPSLTTFQRSQLLSIFAEESRKLARIGVTELQRRLQVRLGSLVQFVHLVETDRVELLAPARAMGRTLTQIVGEELEIAQVATSMAIRRLLASDCVGLRALHGLCTVDSATPQSEYELRLKQALVTGGAESLLQVLGAVAEVGDAGREDIKLLQNTFDQLSSDSPGIDSSVWPWNDPRIIRRVFSRVTFEWLLTLSQHHLDLLDGADLGSYAVFMESVRGEMEAAQALYERALAANPTHANNLGNYADFMQCVRGEMDAAQALYERALAANPTNANNLGNYAFFMKSVRGEMEAAQGLYERALAANPTNANHLGNYAGFLFAEGRTEKAREMLGRARAVPGPLGLALELQFYTFAHVPEERAGAAAAVERLLERGIRSPGWDLRANVARATRDGHPDPELVASFADRIASHA